MERLSEKMLLMLKKIKKKKLGQKFNPGSALTELRLAHNRNICRSKIGIRVMLVNPNQTSETFPVLSLYISERCVNWIT